MTNDVSSVGLRGVSRTYGSTRALIDVDLTLRPGRIVALLGENGAGKSTAAKILCGLESPDQGTVVIDNSPVTLPTPHSAHRHGIYLTPQELAFVPDLTVAESSEYLWGEEYWKRTETTGQTRDLIGTGQ